MAMIYGSVAGIVAILGIIFGIFSMGPRALAFIFLPIIYFIVAYVAIALVAWVYNYIAPRTTGGVEFTLTPVLGAVPIGTSAAIST